MSGFAEPSALVTHTAIRLRHDPSRVYTTLFMPGHELRGDDSRAMAVINRVLMLADDEVTRALADLHSRFADRPSLDDIFRDHFDVVADRLGKQARPSHDRQLLIGAYFTHDVAPEGAALTNPSIVADPDQSLAGAGQLRFILSARAIGEGHVSSVEFRTGTVTAQGEVHLDTVGPHLEAPQRVGSAYRRAAFLAKLHPADETAHLVLDRLGDPFDRAALEDSIAAVGRDDQVWDRSRDTLSAIRAIADNTYTVSFGAGSAISERILVPTGPTEANGIEDARFVRFVDDDGSVAYCATYTAYDGRVITPQILRTEDFRTFTAHQPSGPAATNKGMALFPRRIAGRYACLSRWDRERSFVAWSDDGLSWGSALPIQEPGRAWDLIQVGNCGSPLETTDGWLVLTHGVGPMRTYTIGAMLLDLDDPDRVIATLPTPLLVPHGKEAYGYVPNVVYTCGALIHGDKLVVPYGSADQTIAVGVVDLPGLLGLLAGEGRDRASA